MYMPTSGQRGVLRSNVNTYVCWALILSFSLGCGLILWHAFFGTNPVEKMLISANEAEYNSY